LARPRLGDFGALWKTVSEVDVNAIRREAERGVAIIGVGRPTALWSVDRLLRDGPDRYPPQADPLTLIPLAAGDLRDALRSADLRSADLLIVALDAAVPFSEEELLALQRLADTPRARQVVLLFGAAAEAPGDGFGDMKAWAPYLDRGQMTLVDPESPDAAATVCRAVYDALPSEARLSAARRLPGLRPLYASRLAGEVSLSNATVALASGVPSLVPILGIPISAADTVILTKNQALMVYRLALAFGASSDFRKRMLEITPVVGGAVVWRQVAAALVGLVPGYGILPKTAVAFGGTYTVGLLATRWYETGLLNEAERKRIMAEATAKARETAAALVEQTRAAGGKAGAQTRDGLQKAGRGATALGAGAGRAVRGARRATGAAAGKAAAGAQSAAQHARKQSGRILRRNSLADADGGGGSSAAERAGGRNDAGAPGGRAGDGAPPPAAPSGGR
jgi:uncharacterized protein (DUF697 family)